MLGQSAPATPFPASSPTSNGGSGNGGASVVASQARSASTTFPVVPQQQLGSATAHHRSLLSGTGFLPAATSSNIPMAQQQQKLSNVMPCFAFSSPPAAYAAFLSTAEKSMMNSNQQEQNSLKVEDAMSYLDEVKSRFRNEQHIYNDFLEIMKEFKNQTLDTPGVVHRVANLFRGHTSLILGFNTFLPAGHKIEVNGDSGEHISMVMPNGQLHVISNDLDINSSTSNLSHSTSSNFGSGIVSPTVGIAIQCLQNPPNNNNTGQQNNFIGDGGATQRPPPTLINSQANPKPMTSSVASGAIRQNNAALVVAPPQQQPPIELDEAVGYINKIRKRYIAQPEVYKSFLSILYTYQEGQIGVKEGLLQPGQKVLSEREVYDSVARLFSNQPDLLREFSQFLSDATASNNYAQHHQSTLVTPPALHPTVQSPFSSAASHQILAIVQPMAPTNQRSASLAAPTRDQSTSSMASPSRPQFEALSPALSGGRAAGVARETPPNAHHQPRQAETLAAMGVVGSSVIKRPISEQQQSAMTSLSALDAESTTMTPPKKIFKTDTVSHDMSLVDVANCGSLKEFDFFEKVRKILKDDETYRNFVRCLILYNQEIVSKYELVDALTPFFSTYPEILKWLRVFLNCSELGVYATTFTTGASGGATDAMSGCNAQSAASELPLAFKNAGTLLGHNTTGGTGVSREQTRMHELIVGSDPNIEIDFASCRRNGLSYRALPATYVQPKASGRSSLCDEVLNDTWVSFPSWQSEDTSVVSSKKTQYEESIYRTEEERYELDILIESNRFLMETLESVYRRLQIMDEDEAKKLQFDETLGSRSRSLCKRVLKRLYGAKMIDVLEALTKSPFIAVPVILERSKTKDKEWREAQRSFNKVWREQNEKHYLKSLDHQGINFKQNDFKLIRSKTLLTQIENLYDDRKEALETNSNKKSTPLSGPHLELCYPKDINVFYNVTDLIIHHVKRQSGLQKQEKFKIKRLLKVFLPQLFGIEPELLSDDENDPDDDDDDAASVHSALAATDYIASLVVVPPSARRRSPGRFEPAASTGWRQRGSSGENPLLITALLQQERTHSACSDYGSGAASGTTPGGPGRRHRADSGRRSPSSESMPPNNIPKRLPHRMTSPPLRIAARRDSGKKLAPCNYSLMIFADAWYLFLRLHHILNERLAKMKRLCFQMMSENDIYSERRRCDVIDAAMALRCRSRTTVPPDQFYDTLLQLIKNLLDGQIDNGQFEDHLRNMFVIHAYQAYTMDKLVQMTVKQLHAIVADETCIRLNDLYEKWAEKGGAGSTPLCPLPCKQFEDRYQQEAEKAISGENCFKAFLLHNESKVTLEMIKSENDEDDDEEENDEENDEESSSKVLVGKSIDNRSENDVIKNEIDAFDDQLWSSSAYGHEYRRILRDSDCNVPNLSEILRIVLEKPIMMCRNIRNTKQWIRTCEDNCSRRKTSHLGDAKILPDDAESQSIRAPPVDFNYDESATSLMANSAPPTRTKNFLNITYVKRPNQCLYRRNGLSRGHKTRLKCTESKNRRFMSWHDRWTLANISMEQARLTGDWLMGRAPSDAPACAGGDVTANWVMRLTEACPLRPPQFTVTRYMCQAAVPSTVVAAATSASASGR